MYTLNTIYNRSFPKNSCRSFFKSLIPLLLVCFVSFSSETWAQTSASTKNDYHNKPSCDFTGPNVVCPGSSNVYTASYSSYNDYISYYWSVRGNGSISGSATNRTVTVVSGTGCYTYYILKLTVTVKHGHKYYRYNKCYEYVRVEDKTAPVLTGCPANATYTCITQVPTAATVTATDNCVGSIIPTFTETRTNGTSSCNNVITRTWTATDKCGNTASCTQTITVNDNVAPVVYCPKNQYVYSCYRKTKVYFDVSATDNCGTPTIYVDYPSGSYFYRGRTRVTVTATDGCGNSSSCYFYVYVKCRYDDHDHDYDKKPITQTPTGDAKGSTMVDKLTVNTSPNPYSDQVTFKIKSPVSGNAILKLYTLTGQELAVAFNGKVVAGVSQTVTYRVPPTQRVSMVYRLSVSNLNLTGRLLK